MYFVSHYKHSMELRASSRRTGFPSFDCASDPEEKEISEGEDEDDDRNHKHRRREERSQSLEGDSLDQGLTRPYRKRNRPFENGYFYREGDPESGEIWKNYNVASQGDFSSRFEKRHSNQTSFSRAPLELNQRIRGNRTMSGQVGPVRGRGREPISRGLRDSRLGLVDVTSQSVRPGPVHSALFAGRGFANVSNAHSTSWNAFGLVPGIPNGGLDSLHPIHLQGAMRPAISPSINVGIPRQRCRDFEERGFCLRGDMCPMEHGVNRIVIEDVQSLSQFNLPVSLPGSQLLEASSGQGALPVITTTSSSLVKGKAFHAQNSKGTTEDGFSSAGLVGGCTVGAPDVYDPDQPLWTNDNPKASAALLALNQPNADETESLLDMDLSDQQNTKLYEGFTNECFPRNSTPAGSQSSSVWGRIGDSKRSLGVKENMDSVGTSSTCLESDIKSEEALNSGLPNLPRPPRWMNVDGNGLLIKESSQKLHSGSVRNIRKPSHRALRTLFVNGIPLKENKREALLSHFQKFGEVIDIYIPMHGERAFVQFSKREEAEAALKAPDAVMGNRFIKLWWANRDNIPDDGKNGTSSMPLTPFGTTHNPALSHPFVLNKGKENPHPADGKDGNALASVPQSTVCDHPKSVVTTGPKAPQPQQKKLESLELLKEELRLKQEMLDQKRNEFRRQLDKLEKEAVGSKDVTLLDPATKRHNSETPPAHAKTEASKLSPRENSTTEKATFVEHPVLHTTANQIAPLQEPLKPSFRPLTPLGAPFAVNRFKLDYRPTAFRIVSPLPSGLANVAALEKHFSTYGELTSVELKESEPQRTDDTSVSPDVTARVSFTTRHFAERAFLHGKCWQGHKLQFMWVTSISSGKSNGSGNISASSNVPSDADVQSSGDDASAYSQKAAALETGEPEQLEIVADSDSAEQEKKDANSVKEGFDSGNLSASSNMPSYANVQPSREDACTHSQEIAAIGTGEPEQPATEADSDSPGHDKKDTDSTSNSLSSKKQLS